MKLDLDKLSVAIVILWAIGCLMSMGLVGLAVWAAWHFIAKYW